MKLLRKTILYLSLSAAAIATMTSCNDSKSYADLLRDETVSINNYLADQKIVGYVPADSVFISRQGIAEDIFRKSGSHATGEAYEEEIGRIMQELADNPAKDAPFYRMDDDGNVYMRVVREGDMENRPQYNDLVYFRFTRYNLAGYKDSTLPGGEGNSHDVTNSESIRYANFQSSASSAWGEGIQLPLGYLGYGCEVEMVIRSQFGRSDEIAAVVPYLYTVRYYKSNI